MGANARASKFPSRGMVMPAMILPIALRLFCFMEELGYVTYKITDFQLYPGAGFITISIDIKNTSLSIPG
jgi:hypothetical protein